MLARLCLRGDAHRCVQAGRRAELQVLLPHVCRAHAQGAALHKGGCVEVPRSSCVRAESREHSNSVKISSIMCVSLSPVSSSTTLLVIQLQYFGGTCSIGNIPGSASVFKPRHSLCESASCRRLPLLCGCARIRRSSSTGSRRWVVDRRRCCCGICEESPGKPA